MATPVSPMWNNWTWGELSPDLEGRQDLDKYYNGAKLIENFIPLPHGPLASSPGLRYVASTKDSTKKSRLVPFVFSGDQAYVLEFGHQYIRFYAEQGQIVSGSPSAPYEIASPYTQDQLVDIKFAQDADVMYLAHPNVAPQKLSRTGHTSWAIAAVSFTAAPAAWTTSDYPRAVAFWEARSVWAGSPSKPLTLWLSKSGSPEDLTQGTSADDGKTYTLRSAQNNPVQWMCRRGQNIVIGTVGGIWIGSPVNDAVLPHDFVPEDSYPAGAVQGFLAERGVVFVSRAGRAVVEIAYNLEADGYQARELTLLANHITGDGLLAMAWAPEPDHTLWAVRADGVLVSGTYHPAQAVMGWARRVTAGVVESVTTIPGDGRDEVWCIVRRTVGGADARYVELMEERFGVGGGVLDIEDAFCVDSGLTYAGSPTTTLSGLDHLEGCDVAILADGAVHPLRTVDSGGVSLDWAAAKVHVGLPYVPLTQTMRVEAGANNGTSQGRLKSFSTVLLRLRNTVGGQVGVSGDDLETLDFRAVEDSMDAGIPLFTGDKVIDLGDGWSRDGWLVVCQPEPLPMTLLAIMPQLVVSGA